MSSTEQQQPFNVVLVGCGEQGWETQGPAIKACQDIDGHLVALVDPDPDQRALASGILGVERTYATLEDALAEEETIHGAVIAAPNRFHAPLTIEALGVGLHVLVEKPMALDVGEAAQMARAAREAGKVLVVGYQYPWMHPGLLDLRAAGRLEDVFFARAEWLRFRGIPGSSHHWDTAKGGVGPDLLGHLYSVIRVAIRSAPVKVAAVGHRPFGEALHGPAFEAFDTLEVFIIHEDGETAFVRLAWDTNRALRRRDPEDRARSVAAEEVIEVEFDGHRIALEVPLIGREPDVNRFMPLSTERIGNAISRGYLESPLPVQTEMASVEQARAWIGAARGGRYPITLEDNLLIQATLDAVTRSAARGGEQVDVDLSQLASPTHAGGAGDSTREGR